MFADARLHARAPGEVAQGETKRRRSGTRAARRRAWAGQQDEQRGLAQARQRLQRAPGAVGAAPAGCAGGRRERGQVVAHVQQAVGAQRRAASAGQQHGERAGLQHLRARRTEEGRVGLGRV